MKKILIAAMLCFNFAVNAQTAGFFWDGNDLVKRMREYEKDQRGDSAANYASVVTFQGYVSGVFDAYSGVVFCAPNVTVGQVSALVVQYVNAKPERWTENGAVLVTDALKQAFPCPKKK